MYQQSNNGDAKTRLETAIAEECRAHSESLLMYEELTAKMLAYQMGHGPAPTADDFTLWSHAVEGRVKLAELGVTVAGKLHEPGERESDSPSPPR